MGCDGRIRVARAFVLLMRYSGLSIQDAVTSARDRLEGTLLALRRGKSRELVQVDLPEPVAEVLRSLPVEGRHYFWTGKSAPATLAKLWGKRLRSVAADAKVDNFRSHRLRDTFAVGLLLAGVSMEDVSVLLGHSSIRTTERFYAPWNKSRRDRLVQVVRETFGKDRLLELLSPSNDAVAYGQFPTTVTWRMLPSPNSQGSESMSRIRSDSPPFSKER